jgi:hypothetical protein
MLTPDPPRHLEAVNPRQIKIQQNQLGIELQRVPHGFQAIVRRFHAVSQEPQQDRNGLRAIPVIVDYQNAQPVGRANRRCGCC